MVPGLERRRAGLVESGAAGVGWWSGGMVERGPGGGAVSSDALAGHKFHPVAAGRPFHGVAVNAEAGTRYFSNAMARRDWAESGRPAATKFR